MCEFELQLSRLPVFFQYNIKEPIDVTHLARMVGSVAFQPQETERFLATSRDVGYHSAPDMVRSFASTMTRLEVVHPVHGRLSRFVTNLPPIIPNLYENIIVILDSNTIKHAHQTESQSLRGAPAAYGHVVEYLPQRMKHADPSCISVHELKLLMQQMTRVPEYSDLRVTGPLMMSLFQRVIEPLPHLTDAVKRRIRGELCDAVNKYDTDVSVRHCMVPCDSLEQYLDELGEVGDNLRRSMHYKMFFRTQAWCKLARYYHEDLIGSGLSLEQFDMLYETLCSNPILLCFAPTIPVRPLVSVQTPNSIDKNSAAAGQAYVMVEQSMPELGAPHLFHAKRELHSSAAPNAAQTVAMCAYWSLREYSERTKSVYCAQQEWFYATMTTMAKTDNIQQNISDRLAIDGMRPGGLWTQALMLLAQYQVVADCPAKPTLMGLEQHVVWERVMESAVRRLVERHKSVTPFRLPVGTTVETLTTAAGHALCDEQRAALESVLNNAITVIHGPAGSGKSDLLSSLNDLLVDKPQPKNATTQDKHGLSFELPTLIAVTAQNNNAADLSNLFRAESCFNMHSLVLQHQIRCKSGRRHCFMHHVQVLVIEEASLCTPEMVARVLGTLMNCAPRLARVIVLGDTNQLPSVDCGNFFVDLCSSIESSDKPWARVVRFTHNHRVHPSAALLKRNVDNMLMMNPSQYPLMFDDNAAVMIPFEGDTRSIWNSNLNEFLVDEIRTKAISTIQRYQLDVYNSHFITHTNKIRKVLEDVLRAHYYRAKFPNATEADVAYCARSHQHAFRGCKILFRSLPRNGQYDIITNRIYVVLRIVDIQNNVGATGIRHVAEVPNTSVDRADHHSTRYLILYEVCSASERRFDAHPLRSRLSLSETVECEVNRMLAEIRQQAKGTYDETNGALRNVRNLLVAVPWRGGIQDVSQPAFVTTVHKFQGSQTGTVVHLLLSDLTLELFYTAYSRAQTRAILISQLQHINKSLVRREPTRCTMLVHYLQQALEKAQPIHDKIKEVQETNDETKNETASSPPPLEDIVAQPDEEKNLRFRSIVDQVRNKRQRIETSNNQDDNDDNNVQFLNNIVKNEKLQ